MTSAHHQQGAQSRECSGPVGMAARSHAVCACAQSSPPQPSHRARLLWAGHGGDGGRACTGKGFGLQAGGASSGLPCVWYCMVFTCIRPARHSGRGRACKGDRTWLGSALLCSRREPCLTAANWYRPRACCVRMHSLLGVPACWPSQSVAQSAEPSAAYACWVCGQHASSIPVVGGLKMVSAW